MRNREASCKLRAAVGLLPRTQTRYNPFRPIARQKVLEWCDRMYLLILDSLGNTELLLILVAALIFFGPRRLPQLGRQIGRSLAEFRRASDDFKRTWEREVNLDNFEKGLEVDTFLGNASEKIRTAREAAARELNPFEPEQQAAAPIITPVEADLAQAREEKPESEPPQNEQPKHEWL